MKPQDKAGAQYWNKNWSQAELPKPFSHTNTSLDNYVNLELHKYFQKILNKEKKLSVLEIGCANSIWPIYFHQYFNADVFGLDYSEIGCEKSRYLFEYYKVPAKVYCADLFAPPETLLQKFDLVVSFGVVEHFEDTANCLKACAALVKPGGHLFTWIPNMAGLNGFIQKYVDRKIYDIHMPLTKKTFMKAHKDAGLRLENCDYFMPINLGVVHSGAFTAHPLNQFFRRILSGLSKIVWILERWGIKIPKNHFTSPYIISMAEIS